MTIINENVFWKNYLLLVSITGKTEKEKKLKKEWSEAILSIMKQ